MMKYSFNDGEIRCAHCGDGLPAFECNVRLNKFACAKKECKQAVFAKLIHPTHVIGEEEILCAMPGCGKFAPAGTYQTRKRLFFCSTTCEIKYYAGKFDIGVCLHCGGTIYGMPYMRGKRRFCSNQCQLEYRGRRHTKARAGIHGEILDEYLHGFAKVHYKRRGWTTIRNTLVAFLEYLDAKGITDLENVGPKVITAYIASEAARGLKAHGYVSAIKTFFSWMHAEGRRKADNPVINHIHRVRGNWAPPRPYSEAEMALLSRLIEKRASPMLKLAFALGEECGLRVSEVNNLHLDDLNQVEQRAFIRIPNKTDTPRRPYYHEKVKRYLADWLKVRDPNCGHDFLLHKGNLHPIRDFAHLQVELKKLLTAGMDFETGVKEFKFHRLRHTWATRLANAGVDIAVIMELGGWKSLAGVSRYIKVSERRKEESYQTAMRKIREERAMGTETSVSLEDLASMPEGDDASSMQSAA